MREKMLAVLSALGVAGAESDPFVTLALSCGEWRVKNLTNRAEVPDGLEGVTAGIAVGEYLKLKRAAGQLELAGLDLSAAALRSLQEGDTAVSFSEDDTPAGRLDALIDHLFTARLNEVYRYRRLVW